MPQKQHVYPTLFIGLGGTGKEVLLRVRRAFDERWGAEPVPCVRYLWFDTDVKGGGPGGESRSEAFNRVDWTPGEAVTLLEGSVLQQMGRVFSNPPAYEHIHKWLYPDVEAYGGAIENGAGGVRAVGRLAFTFRFDTIAERLRAVLDELPKEEVKRRTQDYLMERKSFVEVDRACRVVVVSSIAGGTGGGTLLDMLFLLAKLRQQKQIDQVVAVVVMPDIFFPADDEEGNQRSYANAYAALKEVEHFNVWHEGRGNGTGVDADLDEVASRETAGQRLARFAVEWKPREPLSIQGPPFDVAYICSTENEVGGGFERPYRADLFHMVAESLCLDFLPGEFASEKRADYSNQQAYLSAPQKCGNVESGKTLPQVFSRRYAAIGLAKIEIPLEPIRGRCAARLAKEVIDLWLKRSESGTANVSGDVARLRLGADVLPERLGTWVEDARRETAARIRALPLATEKDLAAVKAAFADYDQRLLRRDPDPTRRGLLVSGILDATPRVVEEVDRQLGDWLKEILRNRVDDGALEALIRPESGMLRFLEEALRRLHQPPAEGELAELEVRKAQAEADEKVALKRRERLLAWVAEALASLGVLALGQRAWTLRVLKERLADAQDAYALARLAQIASDEARQVARRAQEIVSGRRQQLEQLRDVLANVRRGFEGRYSEFEQRIRNHMFFISFYRQEDEDKYYRLGKDPTQEKGRAVSPSHEQLAYLEDQFDAAKQPTLLDLVTLHASDKSAIERTLGNWASERFRKDFLENDRKVDVLKDPEEMKDPDKRRLYVQRFVGRAVPLVKREAQIGDAPVNVRRAVFLGIGRKTPESAEFVADVKRELSQIDPSLASSVRDLETGRPWEVYLYAVSYAFPLSSLQLVTNECHSAYYAFYRQLRGRGLRTAIPLHLSEEWEGLYPDLRAYTEDEAVNLAQALTILTVGPVLRVVQMRKRPDAGNRAHPERVEYFYQQVRAGLVSRQDLGMRLQAIEALKTDSKLRRRLLEEIARREAQLVERQLREYYLTLIYLRTMHQPGEPEWSLLERRAERIREDRERSQRAELTTVRYGGDANGERAEDIARRILEDLGDAVDTAGSMQIPVLKGLTVWEMEDAA